MKTGLEDFYGGFNQVAGKLPITSVFGTGKAALLTANSTAMVKSTTVGNVRGRTYCHPTYSTHLMEHKHGDTLKLNTLPLFRITGLCTARPHIKLVLVVERRITIMDF